MSKIATWGMIRANLSSFPSPTSGRENECLTKSEILNIGGKYFKINGSYGDNECVMLDNIANNGIYVSPIFFIGNGLGEKRFNAQVSHIRGTWRYDPIYAYKGGSVRVEPSSGYGDQSIQIIAELYEDSYDGLAVYLNFYDDSDVGTVVAVQINR